MTATSTSRGKDRSVSPGSEPDVTPDAAEPEGAADAKASAKAGGGSAKKRTSAAGQQRDEVVVHVPSPTDATDHESDVRVAGKTSSSSGTSSANETVTDVSVVDTPEPSSSSGSSESARLAADPAWTAATEPPGSVFAGRTDTPPPPPPVAPAYSSPPPPAPSVTRAAAAARPVDGKPPRKAHLQVSRFEPLSVMKFSFVMSLVCFVVLLVAVTVLYVILSGLGVFDSISSTINELTQEQGSKTSNFDASSWFSFTKIFGYTALIGGLNVLIITALATVWSVIYNIAADFVGGVEVTLKEAE